MRTCFVQIMVLFCLISFVSPLVAGGLNEPPEGFVALFNGKNLDGWFGHGTQDPRKVLWNKTPEALEAHKEKTRENLRKHWSVQEGVLVNDGHGLYATTNKDYGDFEFLVEYKTVARADSGIYLRGVPQVQIWDSTEKKKFGIGADKGSGGLWNNSKGAPGKDPLVLADKPFGEWNTFRIIMVGERVTVFLNGKRVVDHARMENYYDRKGTMFRKGPIQLQTHGGVISWRNIFIRCIGPDEANCILRNGGVDKEAPKGFECIFNGKDFTGWGGPVKNKNNYVKDGAIYNSGGTIYNKNVYTDFTVRFEFKLPHHGNNGLALRYPGKGDTAYWGMCELQVLDNKTYKGLNPRQYHGSAYGMVAAHQGFLRGTYMPGDANKPGEWNYQEVTVKGHTIKVELNGTRILNADLSKLKDGDCMYPLEKFKGRLRLEGHFGFAGHGHPVIYRKVDVKKLK